MEVFDGEEPLCGDFERGSIFRAEPTRMIGHWPYYYHRQLRHTPATWEGNEWTFLVLQKTKNKNSTFIA